MCMAQLEATLPRHLTDNVCRCMKSDQAYVSRFIVPSVARVAIGAECRACTIRFVHLPCIVKAREVAADSESGPACSLKRGCVGAECRLCAGMAPGVLVVGCTYPGCIVGYSSALARMTVFRDVKGHASIASCTPT